jgi:hypothetical protein
VRVLETGSKGRPAYSGLGVQKGGFLTPPFWASWGSGSGTWFGAPSQTSLFGGLGALAAKPPKPVQNLKNLTFGVSKGVVRQTIGFGGFPKPPAVSP